ncbi:hypothetical protein CC78DRAFT_587205 [Lojkania enalia]|uniref:F-box domain-containing protein n=1 Tax=Lojkania enalia TaxID=147567 RepID=A0A9P4MXK7_9PLEO|nr:hypothetical protein CC78DRAFT_587205 [Didymosphaeria enalia]
MTQAAGSSPSRDNATPLSLSLLELLPDELVQLIASFLPTSDLKSLALVSRSTYTHSVTLLWRDICLVDTFKLHAKNSGCRMFGDRGEGEPDDHDDTPIIQKLYILAKNPFLASKVQVVTHRCHLPTPNIFRGLPRLFFNGQHLSQDVRLHHLLLHVIRNLVNVHTLRIVFGHWHITRLLLEGLFSPSRPRHVPIRRLWLESCSVRGVRLPDCTGLESLRLRRIRIDDEFNTYPAFRLSRGGWSVPLHNGVGGFHYTTIESNMYPPSVTQYTFEYLSTKASEFDAAIWERLPEVNRFAHDTLGVGEIAEAKTEPLSSILHLVIPSASTLTKLNLDWILWRTTEDEASNNRALGLLDMLAGLRFPHLRAFQMRNAVEYHTKLPNGVYLLESKFLEFLENHPRIQCLAWPLDRFYSHAKPSPDIVLRARKLVSDLGTALVDLRIDTYYEGDGESVTDESTDIIEQEARARRRKFISEFAPHMTKIRQIKLEGGIPRDEKREILRALHFCPLEKIVLIGVSFTVGNTWGHKGEALASLDESEAQTDNNLEEEDFDAIRSSYALPAEVPDDFVFEPSYGWPPSPPFLHTIASHHASTVTELKLCGYLGSPILSHWTPITGPLLFPLRNFHNLQQLVISFWLITTFEGERRDTEIIQSWLDTRSPSSTALVVVTPPASPTPLPVVAPGTMPQGPNPAARPQQFNRWAAILKTEFSPSKLAYRVAADIGPFISSVAKQRKGGVRVRASFCLGQQQQQANDIFDLDIRIGARDQVLEFLGPREEGEKLRWWEKLESRRWF